MSHPYLVTNSDARRSFLDRHGLTASPTAKISHTDLLNSVRALGFVQMDSITTVARAHHMILFSRHQTYKPDQLTHLLETDRSLFEHWTHDASIIPTEFYPFWRHRFARKREKFLARRRKQPKQGYEDILAGILQHVADKGPTMAREVGSNKKKGTGWWDWHPEKTALEHHWHVGNLAVSGRKNFQKIYDLSENVIPQTHLSQQVDEDEFVDWCCREALNRLGMATSGEIAAFWDLVSSKEAARWCNEKLLQKQLIEVDVMPMMEGKPRRSFAYPDLPEELVTISNPPDRIRVLSPFDPLIRDRKRCERLFGFDYRIEVFVSEKKRQYGYYVFPLLEGSRFIGRIDMKRIKDELVVKGLWLEPGIKMGKMRQAALDAELERQRRFIGVQNIVYALK